jgi:hypothetical protein
VGALSTPAEWNDFLTSFAAAHGTSEWPGNGAASEGLLVEAESRLKIALPPSYRAFLSASNGWRNLSLEIPVLRPVERITWFKKAHRDWVQAYVDPLRGTEPLLPSEQDYFNYASQDSVHFDVKHLAHTLCISDAGDSAVLLLNPMVIWPDGEWEAWFFANWLPGASRYRSFADWMRHELAQLSDETFTHAIVPGELPAVYLDGPAKAKRRVRPREEILTFPDIIKRLSSTNERKRVKAVRHLGRLGDDRAIATLLDLLKNDYDYHVRCEAAEVLGRMRAEVAMEPLIAAIDDEGVNSTAIHALGSFRDERSAERLLRILDEGGMYAVSAAYVLGTRGDTRAIDSLLHFLVSKDPRDRHIGDIAGRILAESFQGKGLEALEHLQNHSDDEVRGKAIVGISDLAFGAREKSVKEKARQILRTRLEVEPHPRLRSLLETEIEFTSKKSSQALS